MGAGSAAAIRRASPSRTVAILHKHLIARAFRQGGVEGRPVFRRRAQLGNQVQGAVVGLRAERDDEVERARLRILLEGVKALGPLAGDIAARLRP